MDNAQPPPVTTIPANPLSQLLRRLEAATSRLEDIASSAQSFENVEGVPGRNAAGSASAPELPSLAASTPTPKATPAVAPPPPAPSLPPAIEDIDELAKTDLKKFVDASQGLDKSLAEQVREPYYQPAIISSISCPMANGNLSRQQLSAVLSRPSVPISL